MNQKTADEAVFLLSYELYAPAAVLGGGSQVQLAPGTAQGADYTDSLFTLKNPLVRKYPATNVNKINAIKNPIMA